MRKIARERVRIKPKAIADVFAYCDTLEFFSKRRPVQDLMRSLRAQLQRPVYFKPVIWRGTRWGYRLIINQPIQSVIPALDDWKNETGATITRFHCAYDFDNAPEVPREELIEWLRTNTHLRYRRSTDEAVDVEGTRYAVKRAGRLARPSRDIAAYNTRVGKLDGEIDKIHIELRLETSRAVKNAGIERPLDILTLDPRALFARYIKIADVSLAVRKITERSIEAIEPTNVIDVRVRVQSHMKRTGCDTLTGLKQHYPRLAERLTPLDALNISDRLHWVRPGVIDDVDQQSCGELSCLLPPARNRTRERIRVRVNRPSGP